MTDAVPDDRVVIFVARDVGYSELHWFLRSLDGRGVLDRLLLVCPEHFFGVHPHPKPHHIGDDASDSDRVLRRLDDWSAGTGRAFGGVIGVDEDEQFRTSRRIARRFGLPFHAPAACVRASNKFVQKTRFRRFGVPTSDFRLVRTREEAAASPLRFPCVLKAVSSYGSQYLALCDDRDALVGAFERLCEAAARANGDPRFRPQRIVLDGQARDLDPRREFLVEEWVGGIEFSCDFAARGRQATLIRVARKEPGRPFGFFDGTRLLTRAEVDACGVGIARLTGLCARISAALGARSGVCMVDFKLDAGELVVLEASVRPGLSATNHLLYDVAGYTSLALAAFEAMGIEVDVRIPEESGAVVYLRGAITPDRAAGLRRLHGPDRVYLYDPGEDFGPVPERDPSGELSGYVIVRAPGAEPWGDVASRVRGHPEAPHA